MSKCDACKTDGAPADMVIDHLLPRVHPDFNFDENLRMVHRGCNKRPAWYIRLWRWIKRMLRI